MESLAWVLVVAVGSTLVHGIFLFYAIVNLSFVAVYRQQRQPPQEQLNPRRVAVVIPVRDDWSIMGSLKFTLAMDYPDYEVYIVDDSRNPRFVLALKQLTEGRATVLRRSEPTGHKGGAINHALEWLTLHRPPAYVAILDADHRPPVDFLRRAVVLLEREGVPAVVGWQRHRIGDEGMFGSMYRAMSTACRVNLAARQRLGASPVFTGSAGVFAFDWLRARGFRASITEDWELSLRACLEGANPFLFRDDLWVDGAVPRGVGWFIRQQRRWAEGTVRDTRHYLGRLIRSPLPWPAKVGLLYQGFSYTQSLLLLSSMPLSAAGFLFGIGPPLWLSALLLLVYAGSWCSHLVLGARLEGYGPRRLLPMLIFSHFLMYVMAPLYAWASLRGLLLEEGEWHVTLRRG